LLVSPSLTAKSRGNRPKTDFALTKVYGIEIHEILGRICKINLLLHHDGHTNIEADRSCLDSVFTKPRLGEARGRFHRVVGNPPFGDEVQEGDEDRLGGNTLETFEIAAGRSAVASEHAILERSIKFLDSGGRLGLVLPDGVLNNQGAPSNCPQARQLLARYGYIEAIVSLPDYAFRKSGAQNKTSILFFRRFTPTSAPGRGRTARSACARSPSTPGRPSCSTRLSGCLMARLNRERRARRTQNSWSYSLNRFRARSVWRSGQLRIDQPATSGLGPLRRPEKG